MLGQLNIPIADYDLQEDLEAIKKLMAAQDGYRLSKLLHEHLVLVGHSDPKKPLGKRISGNHLSPLVRVMLESLK